MIANMIRVVVMLIFIKATVAPLIRWVSRCQAVTLAVSPMASAIDWTNKLFQ